jgi:hypothetical protein
VSRNLSDSEKVLGVMVSMEAGGSRTLGCICKIRHLLGIRQDSGKIDLIPRNINGVLLVCMKETRAD